LPPTHAAKPTETDARSETNHRFTFRFVLARSRRRTAATPPSAWSSWSTTRTSASTPCTASSRS